MREIATRLAQTYPEVTATVVPLRDFWFGKLRRSFWLLLGALALTRLMNTLLYEVSPTDPITFGAVALCVILATLLACYIPSRRATKVDPLVALRYE